MSDSTAVVGADGVASRAWTSALTWRSRLRGGGTYLYLLPALVFLALFTYYPMGFSAYLSLFRWNVLNPERVFVGLENYLLAISRKIPRERQDAAWKFIEWMTGSENAAQWSMASGYVATRQSAYGVPAMKEFLAKDARYLVAREQLQYASGKMMAPNFQKVREILKKQLDDAVDAKVTPREAMAAVQKQVEAVIKK